MARVLAVALSFKSLACVPAVFATQVTYTEQITYVVGFTHFGEPGAAFFSSATLQSRTHEPVVVRLASDGDQLALASQSRCLDCSAINAV